ncbi:MAG: hydratase [Clostridiales bacterium]|nr:hydratase [Clostridiales bacterium]
MIQLYPTGVYLRSQTEILPEGPDTAGFSREEARKNTIAYSILEKHTASAASNRMAKLNIRFDCLASHDITYVNIIQTARASGLTRFPVPYVLTNCHNSLCAVGGTINEDDHLFGLTAAQKYGGVYVPAHLAVIHQYMREMMSGGGKMILGSDSHTRYGSLGAMGVGEGGGELVKQLLGQTYDLPMPEVVGVYLTGKPRDGVGPQDVALAMIKAVFENGFVKNKVMEFVGGGVASLNVEYRCGIDVMTTETACLSSIWRTDDRVKEFYDAHGRPEDFRALSPGDLAYYDAFMKVDLSAVEPMIALPFHPSNVYSIRELNENLKDILRTVETQNAAIPNSAVRFSLLDKVRDGKLYADQGVIAGCAGGTWDNICAAADMLAGQSIGNGVFSLSVYPASQPGFLSLMENGSIAALMTAGATIHSAFCGPCFGAGDVPANNGFSVRHTTRNFPSREGAKPALGQIASVALMDARSVAATAANGGAITAANELPLFAKTAPVYSFHREIYDKRVYNGYNRPDSSVEIQMGPNITDWPDMPALAEHLLLQVVSFITDPVTTTDELIPSGDTSSYRSNPLALAEFTLSRKDPGYVARAKAVRGVDHPGDHPDNRLDNRPDNRLWEKKFETILREARAWPLSVELSSVGLGSVIYAKKPGDGSAREQAASCQRVLGGWANIAEEYATKRYRSNLMNWGLLPFLYEGHPPFGLLDWIFIPHIREVVRNRAETAQAFIVRDHLEEITLRLGAITEDEARILLAGCLMNDFGHAQVDKTSNG